MSSSPQAGGSKSEESPLDLSLDLGMAQRACALAHMGHISFSAAVCSFGPDPDKL